MSKPARLPVPYSCTVIDEKQVISLLRKNWTPPILVPPVQKYRNIWTPGTKIFEIFGNILPSLIGILACALVLEGNQECRG